MAGTWKDFVEGELVSETELQNIQDSLVFIYSSESAANTALTSKVDGTLFYDTTANSVKVWNGSSWDAVGGGGKILQVVTGTSTTDSGNIANTTPQDTALAVAITPAASSSKVLVIATQTLKLARDSGDAIGLWALERAVASGSTAVCYNSNFDKVSGAESKPSKFTFSFLDSPSATTAVTYTAQIGVSTTADSGVARADEQLSGTNTSTITAIEIGA
jgi:hypothetical protein